MARLRFFWLLPALLLGCAPSGDDDVAEIRTVLEELPVAWNEHDADAWVRQFGESSTFTNILGMRFEDRAANRARHADLFATIFRDSELSAEVLDIRPIGNDAAVAAVEFTLVGYDRLPPGVEETERGLLRTRLITVFERTDEGWQIVAAQNTALHTAALGDAARPGTRPPLQDGGSAELTLFALGRPGIAQVVENDDGCVVDALCVLRLQFEDLEAEARYGSGERAQDPCPVPAEVSDVAFSVVPGERVEVVVGECGTAGFVIERLARLER